MTTDATPPPATTPPPAPLPGARPAAARTGKKVGSAVLSSLGLLFGMVFTPLGIVAAVNAEPLGAEWSTGSNMINVVFLWFFAFAMLALTAAAAGAVLLARAAKSTGLFVYALVVTAIVAAGAIALVTAAVITVSG